MGRVPLALNAGLTRIRRGLRRVLPAEPRLRVILARRAAADFARPTKFASSIGSPAAYPFEWSRYEQPHFDPPGQEAYSYAKRHNPRILASLVNLAVIRTGETFSLWRIAGRPTVRQGYIAGTALKDGRLVIETGGAICLLATAIYNAAILAGLEPVERHGHSIDSYGPGRPFELGRDATLEYGYLDLRFRNPFEAPVMLSVEVDQARSTACIFGSRPKDAAAEIRVTEPVTTPVPVVRRLDPSLAAGEERVIGEGRLGLRVRTYRLTTAGGATVEEDLGETVYRPVPRIVAMAPVANSHDGRSMSLRRRLARTVRRDTLR